VARAVLARKHPGWQFDAVDADVALKAGCIDDVSDEMRKARCSLHMPGAVTVRTAAMTTTVYSRAPRRHS
jgi:hypothetical protein